MLSMLIFTIDPFFLLYDGPDSFTCYNIPNKNIQPYCKSNVYLIIQIPYMLLTKPPKVAGASIGERKQHKRKLSGGEDLLKGFLHVHEAAAQANMGATPRRYIAFLNTYQQVYSNKKQHIEKRQHHLQVCVLSCIYNKHNVFLTTSLSLLVSNERHLTRNKFCILTITFTLVCNCSLLVLVYATVCIHFLYIISGMQYAMASM